MNDRVKNYYASAVQRHHDSPLTVNQVDRLARKAQNGDKRAKDRLCAAVAGLVESVVSKYRDLAEARGISRDDLRQVGMLKILEGLPRWEIGRSVFRTYAMDLARYGILNLINSAHLVSVPNHTADCAKRDKWTDDQMRYKEATRQAARDAVQTPSSFSCFPETPDLDMPEDEPGFDVVIDQMLFESIWKRAYLTDLMREVITAHVFKEKTFKELGEEAGVTGQCVYSRYVQGVKMLQLCAGTRSPKLAERVA